MPHANGSLPPGPKSPAILQALHLWRRPTAFLESCRDRYGDTFTLRVPTMPPDVHFSHPEAVKEIFTGNPEELSAGEGNKILEPLLGANSLLILDGSRHLRERRLMLPSFHGERMQLYGEVMRSIAAETIDRWPIGRPFALQREMQAITLEVIVRTVFGIEQGPRLAPLRAMLTRLISAGVNPLLLLPSLQVDLGPLSPWGRIRRMQREVHSTLQAEIDERRRGGLQERRDVLSLLMSARDESGEPMRDEELRDEMITLLLAGHETTATALSWTVFRIHEHPELLARIRDEIGEVGGDGRHELLDATIKEAQRLNPIIPEVGRMLLKPARIGRWDLPAGVVASPSIYLTHRRADLWPEPERFLPERFLERKPGPYEFFPFGGGMRRCLGMAFALYEMRVVLAELLSRVRLRTAPGYRAKPVRRSITLAPSEGMPVVVESRRERVSPAVFRDVSEEPRAQVG